MGSILSPYFVPLAQLPAVRQLPGECISEDFPPKGFSLAGLVQLSFLGLLYGSIVFRASNLIADGSELLLLIPSIAPVVGSVVLPVLGAVPDGMIVLFSGMGPRAQVQKQLAVGVGALAGSTIMLLTVPWFLSVYAGRVDIKHRHAMYRQRPKLSGNVQFWNSGVGPDVAATKYAAKAMLFTMLPYFLIQGSAFANANEPSEVVRSRNEAGFALAGLVLCTISFCYYLYNHMKGATQDKVLMDMTDDIRTHAVEEGLISLKAMFHGLLESYSRRLSDTDNHHTSATMTDEERQMLRLRRIVHKFFRKYDFNHSESIDRHELSSLLKDLKVPHREADVNEFLRAMDTDESGELSFDEFFDSLARSVTTEHRVESGPGIGSTSYGAINNSENVDSNSSFVVLDDEEGDEDETPEDLKDLPEDEQQRRILKRSFGMMALGVVLVIIFSDPLVDVFSELGELCGVSAFYISFILAPLASNASEIIASYFYARRKTRKTITISLSTLMGAAILNNTFVLGIFLSLIRFRELDWEFSAETIAILFVEFSVGIVVLTRENHNMKAAAFVLCLFPLSLLLVVFLESSWVGLD